VSPPFLEAALKLDLRNAYWRTLAWNGKRDSTQLQSVIIGGVEVLSAELMIDYMSEVGLDTNVTYSYCNQNLFDHTYNQYSLPTGRKDFLWMSDSQQTVTNVYAWTCVFIVLFLFVRLVLDSVETIRSFLSGQYVAIGAPNETPFSSVGSKTTYIPELESHLYPYPLIACDTSQIPDDLFDWSDPDKPHEHYDLTLDAKKILSNQAYMDLTQNAISTVKHWPPPARVLHTE